MADTTQSDAGPSGATLAEALGFAANAKLLVVNADDAGLCHSANVATVRALEHGWVSSATAMVPCPWFPELVLMARERPGLGIGIHLTLNCEWRRYRFGPVLGPEAVPSLVGPDGYFLASEEETVARGDPEEVRREVAAQIARALALGLEPTHVDNHMGPIHYRREFFEVTAEVAAGHGLPMRCVFDQDKEIAAGHGMPHGDTFGMYYAPPGGVAEKVELYRAHLAGLGPGVHEMAVHLALDDDEWRSVCYVAEDDFPWEDRVADLAFFSSDEARALLAELGIQLIGYDRLRDLWRARRASA